MAKSVDGKEIIPGGEPWSAPGGPHGALVIHGFTGNPSLDAGSGRGPARRRVRGRAAAAARARHLGRRHGRHRLGRLVRRGRGGVREPAARVDRVVVAGLSMGGSLTLWLAVRHPEIAGMVCVNPAVETRRRDGRRRCRQMVDGGIDCIPAIGGRYRRPGVTEKAYDGTPLRPLLSLADAAAETADDSGQDHVPGPAHDQPAGPRGRPPQQRHPGRGVAGPVERISLERSYHVATLDYDKEPSSSGRSSSRGGSRGAPAAEPNCLAGFGRGPPTMPRMAQITRDDVAHVARLARLALTDDEIELFTGQLAAVLDHVARRRRARRRRRRRRPRTRYPLVNVLRADEVAPAPRPRRGAGQRARRRGRPVPRPADPRGGAVTHAARDRDRRRGPRRATRSARSTSSRSTSPPSTAA